MNATKAREFIKTNARPIDKAMYDYYFEGGDKRVVVSELNKFQNADGGYGHGLEADFLNPNSSPIATNDAVFTLLKTDNLDDKETVAAIVSYLASHDEFDEQKKKWRFQIESSKDYPHAIWWEKKGNGICGYNPTVSLAAFMACFAPDETKDFYKVIVKDAFDCLNSANEINGDEIKCYLCAYLLLEKQGISDTIDFDRAKKLLVVAMDKAVCKDVSKYGVEYVTCPSNFCLGKYSVPFTDELVALADAEAKSMEALQKDDGGFDITWQWHLSYKEFYDARKIWRPRVTMEKLLFFRLYSKQGF